MKLQYDSLGFCFLRTIDALNEALNLLLTWRGTCPAAINTSQSLGQIPITESGDDPLMCLTLDPQALPFALDPYSRKDFTKSATSQVSPGTGAGPRPSGSFLLLTEGVHRFLIGREALLLMGFPIHQLRLKGTSERAP